MNLLVGQTVCEASVDGETVKTKEYKPNKDDDGTLWMGYWPFQGEGGIPAAKAGPVVEIKMPASASERKAEVVIGEKKGGCKKANAKKDTKKPTKKPETKSKTEEPTKKQTKKKTPAKKLMDADAVIGASGLSGEAAPRLPQGTASAAGTAGCLLAALALASAAAARVARRRAPYGPVQAPPQSQEAAAPLVEESRAEEA